MAARDSTRVMPHTCLMCGGVFTPLKWLTRKGGRRLVAYSGAKTCSAACEHSHMRKFDASRADSTRRAISGPNNWNWKGGVSVLYRGYHGAEWPEVAERVRKRDGYVCQRCGISQASLGETLHVHHVIPAANFTDLRKAHRESNLTTLCPPCHFKVEKTCGPVQMSLLAGMAPSHRRGSRARGEAVGGSKLTAHAVQILRTRYANGEQTRSLARETGISQSALWEAVVGRTWRHLPVPDYTSRPVAKPGPKPSAV